MMNVLECLAEIWFSSRQGVGVLHHSTCQSERPMTELLNTDTATACFAKVRSEDNIKIDLKDWSHVAQDGGPVLLAYEFGNEPSFFIKGEEFLYKVIGCKHVKWLVSTGICYEM